MVQAAEAAVQATKTKGGRKGKQPKRGQGGARGQQVKAGAARQTDTKARQKARDSVRGWIRAARIDEACQGVLLSWKSSELAPGTAIEYGLSMGCVGVEEPMHEKAMVGLVYSSRPPCCEQRGAAAC